MLSLSRVIMETPGKSLLRCTCGMKLGKLLIVTAVSIGALAVPVYVARAAETAPTPAIQWTPCPEDSSAECGTLRVPVDWARPTGPVLDLAIARRRATDPAVRVGSLLINPGGPGGSGRDLAIR